MNNNQTECHTGGALKAKEMCRSVPPRARPCSSSGEESVHRVGLQTVRDRSAAREPCAHKGCCCPDDILARQTALGGGGGGCPPGLDLGGQNEIYRRTD